MGTLPASLQAALLLAVALNTESSLAAHWGYTGDDPAHWPGQCQTGMQQSPIDLGSSGIAWGNFEPLIFLNYDLTYNTSTTNNGHTVMFQVTDPHNIMVVGGGLNRAYSLEQVHFHWESEHTIMDRRYPLEIHFVHYDEKQGKLSSAAKKKNGLAVIGVLFEETEDGLDNPKLEFLNKVDHLKYNAQEKMKFSLQSLLPYDLTRFYRYSGSLTTPNCDEVVLWTVMEATVPISKRQLLNFRNIHDSEGKVLHKNYRPIQERNERIIYYQSQASKEVPYVDSGTSALKSSIIPTLMLLVYSAVCGNKCT